MSACKRAFPRERDKGPEIAEETWQATNPNKGEPRRVAWSQIMAKDVELDQDQRTVKGIWDVEDAGLLPNDPGSRDCTFKLASLALENLRDNSPSSPLFPDHEGHWVSKLHMVTSWANNLDEGATGHSARRSGAMHYARRGTPIQSIQFLGRWKSSAVFRYMWKKP